MRTKIFLLGLVIALLSACTAEKIVLEEMTITDAAKFSMFKNEKITVSVKDTVKSEFLDAQTKKFFTRKGLINDRAIGNYRFGSDSLYIHDTTFHSVIGLKSISKIKFDGVWDDDLGFVSTNDINKYYVKIQNTTVASIFGGVLGGALGTIIGGFIGYQINRPGFFLPPEVVAGGIFGGIIGTIGGINIGHDMSIEKKDVGTIIKEMKANRNLEGK